MLKLGPLQGLQIEALYFVAYLYGQLASKVDSADEHDVGRLESDETGHWGSSEIFLIAILGYVEGLNV
jgi:hypothetical protein